MTKVHNEFGFLYSFWEIQYPEANLVSDFWDLIENFTLGGQKNFVEKNAKYDV